MPFRFVEMACVQCVSFTAMMGHHRGKDGVYEW